MRKLIVLFVVALLAIGGFFMSQSGKTSSSQGASLASGALVDITLPETLSSSAQAGKISFEAKCAACHGSNAGGHDGAGPPLVHKIYEPSHHGDESFQRAVALGVRGHHWRFGDMAPVEGLSRADVELIVAYIRELQRVNGIH